ncbi:tetratricopeptide repeat protein [Ignavibacteria bacterium CHB1]|nr:MAG: hypothetical protein EDM69_06390 [Chlorobiota bacterium]MBV6399131.1 hypothetical protein [Ignavibacteria bacterium]MCC6885422.1 tetratricopeptide repeat protein [Ignavibacteriales bacterium]MCE7953665.1 hypothetical protein [Chlorobi bacterium CHB7]MDL1887446.1 tetratricopeptide repeat protein [Ignavibacteria bacterium CHB1]RIK49152.1 MAG: hypothetical protein DCC60_04175 [Ignavibacteriota bacterium]
MRITNRIGAALIFAVCLLYSASCNYVTHRTFSGSPLDTITEPDYELTNDDKYQDFVTYIFLGNRIENFSAYFNAYYTAQSDFDQAMNQIETSRIAAYNRRLDSLNIATPISPQTKDLLTKVVERASKVIQFQKDSRFIDKAVLMIGQSYYYMQEYLQAERSLSEFLSKFETSAVRDKAILYYSKTKFRLGQNREAETLMKSLLENSKNFSVKSEAAFDLGVYYLTQKNQSEAMKYLKDAVDLSKDSETRARNQYLLARIYSTFESPLTTAAFNKAIDLSSNLDLTFYSSLNYAKALISDQNYRLAGELLEDMASDYRDYPEFRQLVDLEIANNLLAMGNFEKAKIAYYNVIVDFPGSISASDAYYYLAKYYETNSGDYLTALVNYNKSNQENSNSNFSEITKNKSKVLDKYFTLIAKANNTTKQEIPLQNKELEEYRIKRLEQKGIETAPGRDGIENRETPEGKGGGQTFRFSIELDDSIKSGKEKEGDIKEKEKRKESGKETGEDKENSGKTEEDTTGNQQVDINKIQDQRFSALFQLAEIFMYEIVIPDSAEHYLNLLISEETDYLNLAKAYYTKAIVLSNSGRTAEAEVIYNKIINEYPNSPFAIESKKQLGLSVNQNVSAGVDQIFEKVSSSILNKQYSEAITELQGIIISHPDSTVLPRAYYTLGWIYENQIINKDSALHYYNMIISNYPFTIYNNRVFEKVTVLTQKESDGNDQDKLKNENPETINEPKPELKKDQPEEDVEKPDGEVQQKEGDQLPVEEIKKSKGEGED